MISMRHPAIAAAFLGVCWCGQAAAAVYNVVIVEVARGKEFFSEGTLQGYIDGSVSTTNLPGAVSSRVDYTQGPEGYTGTWRMSAGGSDAISGVFATPGRTFSNGLGRSTGTITINGGEGAFLNASGGGTFEAFTRDAWDFVLEEPYYAQITITRLQFEAAGGPDQVDFRGVSVSARVGYDEANGHGANTGVATSDSNPIELPNVRSEWFSGAGGESYATDGLGNSAHWIYTTDPGSGFLDDVLYKSFGDATLVDGTGKFAGYTGGSTWEAYSVGMGPIAEGVWMHSAVTIDRYTISAPIPEPQTYALMAVGLAFASFAVVRRRSRSC